MPHLELFASGVRVAGVHDGFHTGAVAALRVCRGAEIECRGRRVGGIGQ